MVVVYRNTGAPYLVCINAAQSMYDNEYKSMVVSAYSGQKYRGPTCLPYRKCVVAASTIG